MAVRIEDAGFEIRDMIAWVYGSGFPKSLDVSKAIDKAAGVEREVVGFNENWRTSKSEIACPQQENQATITAPATPEAKQWEGWGTALKPALEPITVARKPLIGTVAENVLQHGTGAINVDGGRVGTEGGTKRGGQAEYPLNDNGTEDRSVCWARTGHAIESVPSGRWPANFIHDGSEEVVGLFPDTKSGKMGPWNNRTTNGSPNGIYGKFDEEHPLSETYGDSGSAARFFYCAKASKADRDAGCEKLQERSAGECVDRVEGSAGMESPRAGAGRTSGSRNHHPTVKPTDLMRYLCRLVTPPNGIVLDPFMGSGSTGKAAMLEGFAFVGIEREAEYVEIAKARIEAVKNLF
jgi:site-specific DNA-methyltransferase (adenine-specific)